MSIFKQIDKTCLYNQVEVQGEVSELFSTCLSRKLEEFRPYIVNKKYY